jgi:sulfite reductase (ferredoxin)
MAAPAPFKRRDYEVVQEAARAISKHLLPRTRAYAELWLDGDEVARVGPEVGADAVEPIYGETYLPRKFKTAVTVAGDNSVDLFTNDLGFVPFFEKDDVVGWNMYVGGGLGRTHKKPATFPRLADALGFVGPDDLLRAAEAVVVVQRDHGDRTNRRHARLKYLIHDQGIEWFRAKVAEAAAIELAPARPVEWARFDDLLGWHEQGDGAWFYGLRVFNGRVRDGDDGAYRSALRAIAHLGIRFRITPNQNVYLVDVPARLRPHIEAILDEYRIEPAESVRGLRRLSMACPALPTCGLAIAEAERALPGVLEQLQVVFDEVGLGEETPTIRMTGCPNGCARPYVAEIGLVGDAVDRYQVWLGGDSAGTRLATAVADRVHKNDLPALLRPLLERYRDERHPDEALGDFLTRVQIRSVDYTPSVPLRDAREEVPA